MSDNMPKWSSSSSSQEEEEEEDIYEQGVVNIDKCKFNMSILGDIKPIGNYIEEASTVVTVPAVYTVTQRSCHLYHYIRIFNSLETHWCNIMIDKGFLSIKIAESLGNPEKSDINTGMISFQDTYDDGTGHGHQLCYLVINKTEQLFLFDPNGGYIGLMGDVNKDRQTEFELIIDSIMAMLPHTRNYKTLYPEHYQGLQSSDHYYYGRGQCTLWVDTIIYHMIYLYEKSPDLFTNTVDVLMNNYERYILLTKASNNPVKVINGMLKFHKLMSD